MRAIALSEPWGSSFSGYRWNLQGRKCTGPKSSRATLIFELIEDSSSVESSIFDFITALAPLARSEQLHCFDRRAVGPCCDMAAKTVTQKLKLLIGAQRMAIGRGFSHEHMKLSKSLLYPAQGSTSSQSIRENPFKKTIYPKVAKIAEITCFLRIPVRLFTGHVRKNTGHVRVHLAQAPKYVQGTYFVRILGFGVFRPEKANKFMKKYYLDI